jgi:hypothetical protein
MSPTSCGLLIWQIPAQFMHERGMSRSIYPIWQAMAGGKNHYLAHGVACIRCTLYCEPEVLKALKAGDGRHSLNNP